ncbi:flagellar type III secretion system pore protein FliP [Jannaschia sp. W003]|uniref:flagellar type III secretion system pore protein FliP n=1 Tax=Jannaschia sp. W003 TaxID=2867012 RepID=UPI0021A7E65F|nr:flagellar type III secretion system pore protein FliP [Jannaschia sp. W003]UWQ21818.1 flagellar type III secretion system pore protein FliP [Jannaschia sp. W003]
MRPLLAALALLPLAAPAGAQELAAPLRELIEGQSLALGAVQLVALLTVLSLAPGIVITITCFPFVVTVLSILRQAIGLQAAPPNMLIISLALFLTWFVMEPVALAAWSGGIEPWTDGALSLAEAVPRALAPFRAFMAARVDPDTLAHIAALRPADADALSVLVPSFLLSEIARAFQIGFLVFMPFLVIDMVVAAVLMSMGMMMVPPAIVSLPFKLAFFVVVDGWALVAGALVAGYG